MCLAFFCNPSSYYGEIYRAGIESVGRGQWEAARSTGLSGLQTLAYVVLPQSGAQRAARPRLQHRRGRQAHLHRQRRLLPRLLYSADMARSLTFNSSPVVLAALVYVVILWPLVRLVSRLERRVAAH